MRAKVLAAIEAYSEGLSITKAIASAKLQNKAFYKALHSDHALMVLYEDVQKARSFMMLDEAYEIGSERKGDPKLMRAMADVRMKLAAMLNPDRFGPRVQVTNVEKIDLREAINEGLIRAGRPPRDLGNAIEGQYSVITDETPSDATDTQSGDAPGEADPFS